MDRGGGNAELVVKSVVIESNPLDRYPRNPILGAFQRLPAGSGGNADLVVKSVAIESLRLDRGPQNPIMGLSKGSLQDPEEKLTL